MRNNSLEQQIKPGSEYGVDFAFCAGCDSMIWKGRETVINRLWYCGNCKGDIEQPVVSAKAERSANQEWIDKANAAKTKKARGSRH